MTTQISLPDNALLVKDVQPFTALCFTTRATLQTLGQYGSVSESLLAEADRLGITIIGPCQWIYTGVNGEETNEFQLEIALPIEQPKQQPDGFSYQRFDSFRCASHSYTGPWSDFMELYDGLFSQFNRDGHTYNGHVREIYEHVDFYIPSNCVTEIQIGLVD